MSLEEMNNLSTVSLSGGPCFYPDLNTALFSLEPFPIPARADEFAIAKGLVKKDEFHMTLVGFRTAKHIRAILKELDEDQRTEALGAYKKLVENFTASPTMDTEKLFFITKTYPQADADDGGVPEHQRQALVALAQMPEIEELYQQLNQIFDTNFDIPFPHVSLYTGSDHEPMAKMGIGVYSQKEFDEMEKVGA